MLDFAIFLRLQVESTMGGWEVGEGQDTAQPTIAFPASTPTADRGFYSSPTNSTFPGSSMPAMAPAVH